MTNRSVPMIHVPNNVRQTVEWYQRIGFEIVETYSDAGDGLSFAVLAFGDSYVMFNAGGRESSHHRRDVDLYLHTTDIDDIYERLKHSVEVIEPPHDTFYGQREVIVRDLNGFWVTFGEVSRRSKTASEVPASVLERYVGTYEGQGMTARVTVQDGDLIVFPADGAAVSLSRMDNDVFSTREVAGATVTFEVENGRASALVYRHNDLQLRLARNS